jgi:hypothetical protein
VCENRVLRRIFLSKTEEATGGWRKLHDEEFYNLHSPNIIRKIKLKGMGRACNMHERKEKWLSILVRKYE